MKNFYTQVPDTNITHSTIDVFDKDDPFRPGEELRLEVFIDQGQVQITYIECSERKSLTIGDPDLDIILAKTILKTYEEKL
jgi:hypothetical protein